MYAGDEFVSVNGQTSVDGMYSQLQGDARESRRIVDAQLAALFAALPGKPGSQFVQSSEFPLGPNDFSQMIESQKFKIFLCISPHERCPVPDWVSSVSRFPG